ncbi:MAG: HAMP domain-containing protein [Candidatus Omnitrophota bacterium]
MRRRYIIGTRLQFKYLGLLLTAMIVPTAFVSGCLYYLMVRVMEREILFPEAIASLLVPATEKVNTILLIGMPVIFILLVLWGIVWSHRLAGPVYRLEKELDKVGKGDFSVRIKFRKKDELQELAQHLNKVLDHLEMLHKRQK